MPRKYIWIVWAVVVALLLFSGYYLVSCISPEGCSDAGANISRVIVGILRFIP